MACEGVYNMTRKHKLGKGENVYFQVMQKRSCYSIYRKFVLW